MSPKIPTTVHGLNLFGCLSGLQKCIRRGLERQAMLFACELGHTSKGFATAVGNGARESARRRSRKSCDTFGQP